MSKDVKKARRVVYKDKVYMVLTLEDGTTVWVSQKFIAAVMK